jgi:hypothetical protein
MQNREAVWLGQVDVEVPGGERYWRPVIRLHRVALVVLLDDHDRVLMLWRHRYRFVPDRWGWELPGGPVDADEEPWMRRLGSWNPERVGDPTGLSGARRAEWVPLASIPGRDFWERADKQLSAEGRQPAWLQFWLHRA